jgi:hypothetical protein
MLLQLEKIRERIWQKTLRALISFSSSQRRAYDRRAPKGCVPNGKVYPNRG